jgi:tRNA G37 N-methylase TrmD
LGGIDTKALIAIVLQNIMISSLILSGGEGDNHSTALNVIEICDRIFTGAMGHCTIPSETAKTFAMLEA